MIRLGTIADCRAVYLLICELEDCELNYADFERIYGETMQRGDFYSVLIAQKGDEVLGEATLRLKISFIIVRKLRKLWNFLLRRSIDLVELAALFLKKLVNWLKVGVALK